MEIWFFIQQSIGVTMKSEWKLKRALEGRKYCGNNLCRPFRARTVCVHTRGRSPGIFSVAPAGLDLNPLHQRPKRLLKTKEISSFNDYSIFGNIFGVRKLACALQYKLLLCSCLKAACKRPSFACGPHSKLKIYHSMRLASFGTISLARGCCLSPLRGSKGTYVSFFFALLWKLYLNLFSPFFGSVAFACPGDSV